MIALGHLVENIADAHVTVNIKTYLWYINIYKHARVCHILLQVLCKQLYNI